MGQPGHERLGERRIRPQRFHHDLFRVHPDARRRGSYGIAMIGVSEQRGFSEELATTRRVKDHQMMVIDGSANQAQPTAFDLVDGRSRVALPEK